MNGSSHRVTRQVCFQHCDPAGIVFYPRYFELLEEIVSTWLAGLTAAGDEAGLLAADGGMPRFERIDCRFSRPSLLGEHIDYTLTPSAVEPERLVLDYRIDCGEEERVAGSAVLRWYRLTPAPSAGAFPPELVARLSDASPTPPR